MNPGIKTALVALAKSVVDRAVAASGLALASYGVLDKSQLGTYDIALSGLAMTILGLGIGWYRDYGKEIIKAEMTIWKANAEKAAAAATAAPAK